MHAKNSMTRRSFVKAGSALAALAALGSAAATTVNFKEAMADEPAAVEVKPGGCHSCHFGKCSLNYTVKNGVLVGAEGNPDGPFNKGRCCVRGQGNPAFVYNPYRVKAPMKRTNPEKTLDNDPGWVEISYDEAIQIMADNLGPCARTTRVSLSPSWGSR